MPGATTSNSSQALEMRVARYALAVLLLTSIHHVYGAYVYDTPWRLQVAYVSGFAAAAILASLLVLRREASGAIRAVALSVFVAVTLVLPVLGIGVVEGAYNHVLKNALYFGGAPPALFSRLFPPPAYELPNDAFFELSGVLQVVPAGVTAWFLYRALRSRLARGMRPAAAG